MPAAQVLVSKTTVHLASSAVAEQDDVKHTGQVAAVQAVPEVHGVQHDAGASSSLTHHTNLLYLITHHSQQKIENRGGKRSEPLKNEAEAEAKPRKLQTVPLAYLPPTMSYVACSLHQ